MNEKIEYKIYPLSETRIVAIHPDHKPRLFENVEGPVWTELSIDKEIAKPVFLKMQQIIGDE